uniref:Orphan protein n=1 Tax=Ascaris lumbricoides TaxID=6252 RepID=A0A0M3IP20_ASCLU
MIALNRFNAFNDWLVKPMCIIVYCICNRKLTTRFR